MTSQITMFLGFLALVKFHKILSHKTKTEKSSRLSLEENKFFIISLVTQFIFGSISNHRKRLQTRSLHETILEQRKQEEKKLEKFIEFDLSTVGRSSEAGTWKLREESCYRNMSK